MLPMAGPVYRAIGGAPVLLRLAVPPEIHFWKSGAEERTADGKKPGIGASVRAILS
jgi:hypothetical protein